MAFAPGPFGSSSSPEPGSSQAGEEVAKLQKQLEEVNSKFEAQRNLLLQSTNNHSQEISLLRKQLSEAVSRNTGRPEPAAPSGNSDNWMEFLGVNPQQSQPQQQSQQPLTAEEVRRIYQEEEARKQQAHAQEHQKVEQLNARFAVEHPELAKDPNAVTLIRNQFLALSQVRPDLTAEQRYQFAIDNVVKDVLPNLKIQQPVKEQPKPKATNNPYMPNIFAAPPGRGNVQEIMGMVDTRSENEKFADREKQMRDWQKSRNTSLFGI